MVIEDFIAASSFLPVVLLVFRHFYFPMLSWQQKENSVHIYLSKHEQLMTAKAMIKSYSEFHTVIPDVLIHRFIHL